MPEITPAGHLEITPTAGVVTVTTPGPVPVTLDFDPSHVTQIADELDRRALRQFTDPDAQVTLYIDAPHFTRVHIPHPAHLATNLRRAAAHAAEGGYPRM